MSTLPPPAASPVGPAALIEHDALPAGTRFGEFEILRVLGVGGFGIVYLAQDHSLEREVALKEYMPASLAARGLGPQITVRSSAFAETYAIGLRSFVNEARLLARFDHPSLVKVYRFWEDNATAYMVMPYLQGVTLRDTRRAMPYAPDEAWIRSLIAPVLGALELLHREGVYHRDIAPDNILIPREGPPVLLDFGAARRVISDRTQTLTAILKPSYAPIEQYAEMTQLRQGPWTDLYALGAVIHYLLFGAPPPPATARAVQDADPIENRTVAGVSPRFLDIVAWLLELRPNQRPQNVEALRAVLDGAPLPARTPGITLPGVAAAPAVVAAFADTQVGTAAHSHVQSALGAGPPRLTTAHEATQLMPGAEPATLLMPGAPEQTMLMPAAPAGAFATDHTAAPAAAGGFPHTVLMPAASAAPPAGVSPSPHVPTLPPQLPSRPRAAAPPPAPEWAQASTPRRGSALKTGLLIGGLGILVAGLGATLWSTLGQRSAALEAGQAARPEGAASAPANVTARVAPVSPPTVPTPVAVMADATASAPVEPSAATPASGAAPVTAPLAIERAGTPVSAAPVAIRGATASRAGAATADSPARPVAPRTPSGRSTAAERSALADRSAAVAAARGRPVPRVGSAESPSVSVAVPDRGSTATVSAERPRTGSPVPLTPTREQLSTAARTAAESVPASAREACGKRVFIALAICMDERCEEPRYRQTAECVRILEVKRARENR